MNLKYKYENLHDLVYKSQQDDKMALEELIRREQKDVYSTLNYLGANPDEIPDLVQEILFKTVKNIKTLKKCEYFRTWLNQIIIRHFYDSLRKKKRKPKNIVSINAEDDNIKIDIPDNKKTPHGQMLENELDFIIRKSIRKLPEAFRITIIMRELQGLTYEEIANATNASLGTVKSRIARARYKLQEYIKPYIS